MKRLRIELERAAWAWGLSGRFNNNQPGYFWENTLGLEYGLVKQGEEVGLPIDKSRDEDIRSLQETTLHT